MAKYFYSISRRDLPVHQQAIQAAHAQHEYCRIYGTDEEHPTFVWLTVENISELFHFVIRLYVGKVRFCSFVDKVIDETLDVTAIACMVEESDRHIFEKLPLWNCYQKPKGLWKKLKFIFS